MSDLVPATVDDPIRVVARGRVFTGWTSAQITTSLEDAATTFALGIAGVYATHAGQIKEGDDVEISIGDDAVVIGVAEEVERGGDGNTISVQISGRSRTRNAVDCSAPLGTWLGQRLSKLASLLLASYEIPVIDEAGVGDALIPRHHTEEGETLFDAFDRLGREQGFLVTDDPSGRIVFTRAGAGGRAAAKIVRGAMGFLSGKVRRSVAERHSVYTVRGQSFTDVEVSADVQGGAVDRGILEFRELILKADRGVTPKDAAARAQWEATSRAAKALTADYELRDWRQTDGTLWRKNQIVEVTDGLGELDAVDLLIVDLTFTLDDKGRRTTLRLGPQEGFTPPPTKTVNVSAYTTPDLELSRSWRSWVGWRRRRRDGRMTIGRVVDRLLGAITWAKVTASRSEAGKIGKVWVQGLVGNFLQSHQPYGFQSRPLPGADAVVLSMGSSATDRIVTQVGDRRYTLALNAAGDVAVYNDLGYRAVFGRDGVVVAAPSIQLGTGASLGVARATNPVSTTFAADFALWAGEVTAGVNAAVPGSVTAPVPTSPSTGTITAGSAVVKAVN